MKRVLPLLLSLAFFAPVFSDDTVGGPGGTFISQFLDEGTALTRRSKVNWTGAGVSCVDNSAQKRLDCTVTSTGSGGASATFAVNYNNVLVSSPTSTLNFMPPLTVSLQGSTSAQISLTPISLSTGVVGTVDISTQTNLSVTSPLYLNNDTIGISAISLSTGIVGPLNVSSGTITQAYFSTVTFADGTTQTTAASAASGDITAVIAGTGLSGGGVTGAVTLSLDPNATNYIQNQTAAQQNAGFYVAGSTVGGAFISTGTLTIDNSGNSSGSSISFNPNSSNPVFRMTAKSAIISDFGLYFMDSNGYDFMAQRFVPSSNGTFTLFVSSYSGGTVIKRYEVTRDTGIHKFFDTAGTKFIEFNPVGNSSFTIPAYFASSMTLSGGYGVQNVAPTSGQVLKFDGTNWKPDTDLNSGGGGTTIWVKEDGSAIDNAVSTMNFTSGLNTTSSPSGQVNVAVDYSTVASRGDVILKQNSLQSGATAYPDFIYNGSSASLKGVTLNDLTASLPIKTDANKKLTAAAIDVGSSEATGTLAAGRFPALTGDVTTSAGSLTATVVDDSHNHTVATSTFAVTGGTFTVTGGTTTIGGVTYKWPQAQASGTKILSNDGTGQLSWATDATSAGGGDNFGSHVATRQVDMAGFPILNVSSIGVTGSGNSAIDIGTNTALSFIINGSTWDLNASSLTYRGTAALLGTNIAASSVTLSAFYSDANVRSNLGLAIGTNVQAWDADLDDLADGSLTGSKVGSGVPAANIASGSLGSSVIASSISATALVSSFPVTGVTAGSYTNANVTINAQGMITSASNGSAGGGGASTLEVFSNTNATRSSPTASISLDSSMNMSVTGSTAVVGVSISSDQATVQTFTNKTFDAQSTGNVLAFQDTWQWNNSDSLFSGTTYYTTTSTNPMYGHGTFAGSNSTSTCGVYIIGNTGADFDTNTDLSMVLYDFTGGVDTSSRTYIVSVATYTTGMNLSTMTYGSPITVTISNFSVGGLNRRGASASTTLTGWKSVLSANSDFAVAIRRQGDSATLDLSTIDSYFGGAIITRGRRQ